MGWYKSLVHRVFIPKDESINMSKEESYKTLSPMGS